jgi:C1A family cysteine protease
MSRVLSCKQFVTLSACAFASLSFSWASAAEPLPDSYDLRNIGGHSYIGPVRDQGTAGSCYAFSALDAAESAYNLANGLYDDKCADFSESFIVWTMDPYYDRLHGADGSEACYDELQALVDYGVCSEAEFPYSETKPTDGNDHMSAARVKFTSWHRLPTYDVETMKRALSAFGALDVGLLVDKDFAAYKSGVFSNDITSANSILDYDGSMNHAVGLVGWNGDTGTWILRNSWGTDVWGEAGYGNISYYSSRITTAATYIVYGDWTGENFTDVNTGATVATAAEADGTTHAYGYYRWGGNDASLTNSGSFTAQAVSQTGNAFTYGAFLWGGENASLTNSGSVSSYATSGSQYLSTAYGLCLQGDNLTNTGSVYAKAIAKYRGRSTAYGIRFFAFDSEGAMSNSGSVSAYATGSDSYAIGVQANGAASIKNTGSILAEAYASAGGLVVDECASVVNTGNITATCTSGDAYGVYARYSDFTNEAGGVVTAKSYNGTSYGVFAVSANVHNDGKIIGDISRINVGTLSGSGSFVGNLECISAVLSPGEGVNSVGTMTVTGDFESSVTFTVNLDVSGTKSDVLAVGGTAAIDKDTVATLNVIPNGYVTGGDYTFITTSGASGAFTAVNTTAMFEGSVTTGANGFTLDLTRNSYASFSPTGTTTSMAKAMDVARPVAAGNFAAVLNTIDSMEDGASVSGAITNLFPAMNATATFAALGGLRRTGSYIERHFKDGISTDDGRRYSTWCEVMNARERRATQNIFPGYDEDMNGVIAGADRKIGQNWTFGAAASNATQSLDAGGDDSASIRTRRGYLYAMWDQNPDADGLYFISSTGIGSSRINTRRAVEFVKDTVTGSHGADNYSFALGTGYDVGDAIMRVRPFVNAEYDLLSEDAYTETSSQGTALSFEKNDSDSLSGQVGLAVSTHVNLNEFTIVPEVRVYRAHEFLGGVDGSTASFAPGALFDASGRALSENSNVADLTLRVIWANRVTAGVNYEHVSYNDSSDASDSASAFVQVRF